MPFGDRTGPSGLGPRTGRGAGYCSGSSVPGYMNPLPGGGWFRFGRGRARGWFGGGRGWRHRYWATGLPGWAREAYGYPPLGIYPYVPPPSGAYPYAPTTKEEMDILKDQAEFLRKDLEEIQNRISTLEKAQEQESK